MHLLSFLPWVWVISSELWGAPAYALRVSYSCWHGVMHAMEIKNHLKSPEDQNYQLRGKCHGWERGERTEAKYLVPKCLVSKPKPFLERHRWVWGLTGFSISLLSVQVPLPPLLLDHNSLPHKWRPSNSQGFPNNKEEPPHTSKLLVLAPVSLFCISLQPLLTADDSNGKWILTGVVILQYPAGKPR